MSDAANSPSGHVKIHRLYSHYHRLVGDYHHALATYHWRKLCDPVHQIEMPRPHPAIEMFVAGEYGQFCQAINISLDLPANPDDHAA